MKKIERKDFLKLAGGVVGGSVVGTVFSGAPFDGLQWLVEWTQDQYVPARGAETSIQNICQACPNGCNLSIRMIGERAVKVETSNGACPVGQTLLQELYHPERIQTPLKRVGKKGSGKFMPISWEEAVKDIAGKINKIRKDKKPQSIAAINGTHNTAVNQLLGRLVKASGSGHIYHDTCFCDLSQSAVQLTQKVEGSLEYDVENADYILSFGARLMEGWGEPNKMYNSYLKWKKNKAKFVQIDTICTRTASMADKWIPLAKAGTESILAMGIAYQLITKHGKSSNVADLSRWSGLNEFTPQKVSAATGVPVEVIEQTAKEFVSSRKPVAVAGRGGKGVSSSVAEIVAVQCLNKLVDNLGKAGGVYVKMASNPLGEPKLDAIAEAGIKNTKKARGLDEFIAKMENIELLFINEGNPVHRSVYGKKLADKMKDIPMVVSFMPLINDTAMYADYILPTLTVLEIPANEASKAVGARFKAKHTGDIVLEIAKNVEDVSKVFTWASYKDVVKLSGKTELRSAASFSFSTDILKKHFEDLKKKMSEGGSEFNLSLIPFEIPVVGDGRGMALPYVLKSIDGNTFSMGRLYVHMNPETAAKNGVCEGSNIYLISKRGEIGKVRVHLTKTVAPDVVAVPLGFGHEGYTVYADDKGVNPKEIMSDSIDPESGVADWWYTRIKIS